MRKTGFSTNEYYHVFNRGVEKRDIFGDDLDRNRFLLYLSAGNSESPLKNISSKLANLPNEAKPHYGGLASLGQVPREEQLVHIVAYALMPNHFHILLKQNVEGGVSKFMQKLGTGYTMYFNQRYERVGSLFQGTFKAVPVINDRHMQWLPHYIHANPLDMTEYAWRSGSVGNLSKVMEYLNTYRWSSYRYFAGLRKKDFIIDDISAQEILGSFSEVHERMSEWIRDMAKEDLKDLPSFLS